MKVVHVQRLRGVGGSERHLLTLLPALRERGVDATFIGLDDADPDPFYAQLDHLHVPYVRLRAPRDLDPALGFRLRRSLRRAQPDIVHTHLVHADVYGAATGGRATIVSTKHNDDPFRLGPFRHVERLCARDATRIICITEALARFNRRRRRHCRARSFGRPLRPGRAPPPGGEPRGGPSCPPHARVLLALSRLEQQKGLDVAITRTPARSALPSADAVLVVLGPGSLMRELEELAASRRSATPFACRASVGDVADWLERAELFVHPARWEGFGLVLLEAMLAAFPSSQARQLRSRRSSPTARRACSSPRTTRTQLAAAVDSAARDPPERAGATAAAGRSRGPAARSPSSR